MKTQYIVGLFTLMIAVGSSVAKTNVVNCYYSSWAKYRNGIGKVTVQDINPKLCTHITYAFIGLKETGEIDPLGTIDDYPSFIALKKQNPHVKLIISMGGWNQGSKVFSEVTNNNEKREKLVQAIHQYVTSHKFDGFDLDWEYPGQRGGAKSDRNAYVTFLQDLRKKFGNRLLITAAVGADIQSDKSISYNVPQMNKYLNYFNVMAYDYHDSADGVTGENAPLYAGKSGGDGRYLSVDASISGWIAAGASRQKVLLGLAFYGHTFTLKSPGKNGIGAPTKGPGAAGRYSAQPGNLEYYEICEDLRQGGWRTVFDKQQQVPYSYKGEEWIGYDNVQSIELKTKYAMTKHLGGVLIWSISSDDWRNTCHGGKWPLLNAVDRTMKGKH